ncbi:MAG: FtsW/RodA/SpoVE family cell cycle protein [Patescibacteria group bacterium]
MIHKKVKTSPIHPPDLTLLGLVLLLLAFGVLMVYNASVVESLSLVGGQYHYLLRQGAWVGLGALGGLAAYFPHWRIFKGLSPFLFIGAVLALIFVLIPSPFSSQIGGSRSWLALPVDIPILGSLGGQPSEFAKLALILYLAALFTKRKRAGEKGARFWDFLLPTALLCALVIAENDIGNTVIVALLGVSSFFFAGGAFWQMLLLLPLGAGGGVFFWFFSSTFQNRIRLWLDSSIDPQGLGYQLRQIAIALGSGGFLGLGLGESKQKYGYIPEVTTDAIFAILGEEIGFIGALLMMVVFLIVIYRGFLIARDAPDDFSQLAAAGITAWFGLQTVINLASLTGLIPWTGITLPLISYGGSSLIATLVGFGILLNISRFTRHGIR